MWQATGAVGVATSAVRQCRRDRSELAVAGVARAPQRMLAARTEDDSLKAILWFNVAHYGLRPWPWIIVAMASMVVYPTLESIQAAFPGLDPSIIGHDLAYPAMLVFLPSGLLGLVVASLAAAYMPHEKTKQKRQPARQNA